MNQARFLKAMAVCALAALGASACARDEQPAPVAQTQTQTPVQAMNQPVIVAGCLRAGDAEGTFVLTTHGTDAATYHLTGARDVNLVDHIGRQIEVNGTVRARQQITSQAAGRAEDKVAGTAGTPKVETKSELEMKHLEVTSVRPLGNRCDR